MMNIANNGIENRIIRSFLHARVKYSFGVTRKSCTRTQRTLVARERGTFKREISHQGLVKLIQMFRQTSPGKTFLTEFAITLLEQIYRKPSIGYVQIGDKSM